MSSAQNVKHDNETRSVIIEPVGKEIKNSLIFLHGLGNSAHGIKHFFHNNPSSPICNNTRVILLTAPEVPVTITGGHRQNAWFDIISLGWKEKSLSKEQVLSNTRAISDWLQKEIDFHNGDATRVFIGGFSQGCSMALHVGLTYPKKLGGIIALGGFLFPFTKATQQPPTLIAHGTNDSVIPIMLAEMSYKTLPKWDTLIWKPLNGAGHSVCPLMFKAIKDFWHAFAKK